MEVYGCRGPIPLTRFSLPRRGDIICSPSRVIKLLFPYDNYFYEQTVHALDNYYRIL